MVNACCPSCGCGSLWRSCLRWRRGAPWRLGLPQRSVPWAIPVAAQSALLRRGGCSWPQPGLRCSDYPVTLEQVLSRSGAEGLGDGKRLNSTGFRRGSVDTRFSTPSGPVKIYRAYPISFRKRTIPLLGPSLRKCSDLASVARTSQESRRSLI